jgi:hypothetical protein
LGLLLLWMLPWLLLSLKKLLRVDITHMGGAKRAQTSTNEHKRTNGASGGCKLFGAGFCGEIPTKIPATTRAK